MAAWLHNLRHAWRMLGARPFTSALAVVVLALGIGSTGIQFAVIDGIVLRPLPVPDGERVLHVDCQNPSLGRQSLHVYLHDFRDWQAAQESFTDLGAFTQDTFNLSDDENFPERVIGSRLTPEVLPLLEVKPLRGRVFSEADAVPGAPSVAVIGYRTWRNRFAGDEDVLGLEIHVNGEKATIVGVMPPGFHFPMDQDLWLPLQEDVATVARGEGPRLRLVGRLRDGVSVSQTRIEMETLAIRTATSYPEISTGRVTRVLPYTRRYVGTGFLRQFYLMYSASWLVLLIACANVASLLMARTAGRTREIALRTALGASNLQVMGQILAESLLLALAGTTVGLAVAWVGTTVIATVLDAWPLPYWMAVGFNLRVVAAMSLATLAAALGSGIYPAWKASRADVTGVLKDESRTGSGRATRRFSRTLLTLNIAFASLLLVFTALLIRSATRLANIEVGVEPERVFTARLDLPATDYPDREQRLRLVDQLVDRLARHPDVVQAVATTNLPAENADKSRFAVEGQVYPSLEDYPEAFKAAITPGFFELFGVAAISGRLLGSQDREETEPVLVVNKSFAQRTWPGEEPIGQRLRLGRGDPDEPWRRVVGVVDDLPMGWIQSPSQHGFYVPYTQDASPAVALAVLTRDDPLSFADLARGEVRFLDRDLPIFNVRPLEQILRVGRYEADFFTILFSSLGLTALFLAALGIYGMTALSVNQRTAEIGLRIALGAQRGRILRAIVGEGLLSYLLGLVAGMVVAAFTTPYLRATLYDVDPFDSPSILTVAVFLGFLTTFGCLVPAWRASRIEPSRALHTQ